MEQTYKFAQKSTDLEIQMQNEGDCVGLTAGDGSAMEEEGAPEEVATHAWGSQGSAIRARVRVHAKGAHGWSGEVLTWCATTVVGGGDVDGGGSCGCEVEEEGEEIMD